MYKENTQIIISFTSLYKNYACISQKHTRLTYKKF